MGSRLVPWSQCRQADIFATEARGHEFCQSQLSQLAKLTENNTAFMLLKNSCKSMSCRILPHGYKRLILLLRVDSTSDSTYSYQAELSRCLEEVTLRSRPIWKVGIEPIISCISWVTGQKTYHNLTRCMTSQGFRSVPMRWYNINVQKKSLSWITLDYTAHLHTTERVRWEFQWTIFWCELPCVGSLTPCFWLKILWGWYWYWVFFRKTVRLSKQ